MKPSSLPAARLSDHATLRMVCLPYAGGGSALFHRWRSALPPGIDLVPLTLPGHDGRLGESPRSDLCALARELADDLRPAIDRPYVLVGHSLGAWLAFELARELRRRRRRLPELLVAAAARPPDTPLPESPVSALPDDELLATVDERYGGIPPAIRDCAELLQMLMPALRADLQMVETYSYTHEPALEVDTLALGGVDDPAVSATQLNGWRRHTSRGCSVRLFPGDHFFLFRGDRRATRTGATEPTTAALQTIVGAVERVLRERGS